MSAELESRAEETIVLEHRGRTVIADRVLTKIATRALTEMMRWLSRLSTLIIECSLESIGPPGWSLMVSYPARTAFTRLHARLC